MSNVKNPSAEEWSDCHELESLEPGQTSTEELRIRCAGFYGECAFQLIRLVAFLEFCYICRYLSSHGDDACSDRIVRRMSGAGSKIRFVDFCNRFYQPSCFGDRRSGFLARILLQITNWNVGRGPVGT